jgi:sulfopyruvate decarboxylase subunit alpha
MDQDAAEIATRDLPAPAAATGPVVPGWESDLADSLVRSGCTTFALVPDKRLDPIVARLRTRGMLIRSLAAEEECVAYAAGYMMAGGLAAVLMQSSGLGNAINAIASLVLPYGLGIPMVISMRGTIGERNPSQVPMGRATAPILTALGIQEFTARNPAQVETIAAGIVAMAQAGVTSAMLLDQELPGRARPESRR